MFSILSVLKKMSIVYFKDVKEYILKMSSIAKKNSKKVQKLPVESKTHKNCIEIE